MGYKKERLPEIYITKNIGESSIDKALNKLIVVLLTLLTAFILGIILITKGGVI